MNALIWMAGLLAVGRLVVVTTFKIVSLAVHLLIVLAGVLLVVWVVRKLLGHGNNAVG